jgi:hypothetical protein
MSESIIVTSNRTEVLDTDTRASLIDVRRIAHQEDDFIHLFSNTPSSGIQVLVYLEQELVCHAVATTRWLQPEGLPVLGTDNVDAVDTLPAYQGQGTGSKVMGHPAAAIIDFEIACLESNRVSFYAKIRLGSVARTSGWQRSSRICADLWPKGNHGPDATSYASVGCSWFARD